MQLICLLKDTDGTLRLPHDCSRVATLGIRRMSDGGVEDVRRLMNAELSVADARVLLELAQNPQTRTEWEEVGMLQKHHLVTFTDGVAVLGDVELQLDNILGLRVVRGESEGEE